MFIIIQGQRPLYPLEKDTKVFLLYDLMYFTGKNKREREREIKNQGILNWIYISILCNFLSKIRKNKEGKRTPRTRTKKRFNIFRIIFSPLSLHF